MAPAVRAFSWTRRAARAIIAQAAAGKRMTEPPIILGEGDAAKHLRAIADFVTGAGGWLAPDLVIDARTDAFAMRSESARATPEPVIRVPLAAMPLVRDFDFRIAGGDLVATPAGNATPLQVAVMGHITALYNAAGKLRGWLAQCPLFTLSGHDRMLSHLLNARANAAKIRRYRELIAAGDAENLTLASFFNARMFSVRNAHLRRLNRTDIEGSASAFLPLIDCFNHSLHAEPFGVDPEAEPLALQVRAAPDPSGELFVRYNLFDALETYLFFGFVDRTADWLGSVPFAHDLAGGARMVVTGEGNIYENRLPAEMRSLRPHLPRTTRDADGTFRLSKLIVPGPRQPDALRRVAAFLLSSMGIEADTIAHEVARLEEHVLDVNRRYWREFAARAAELPADTPAADLHALSDASLSHLAGYARTHGL